MTGQGDSFPARREESRPFCGHCGEEMVPAVGAGRPLWRCPVCRIIAIAYPPTSA